MDKQISQQELAANLIVNITKVIKKPTSQLFQVLTCYMSREWSLEKTYEQLADLFKSLQEITYDIEFNGKSLIRKYDAEDMRKQLNIQIQKLSKRRDVLQLRVFRDFLHLDSYLKVKQNPLKEGQYIESNQMAVIDFSYEPKLDILLTLEVLGSVKAKVKTFFRNIFKSESLKNYQGQVCLFSKRLPLWSIQFKAKPVCFSWNIKSTMLLVSLDNNEIMVYRVAVENGYREYQQFTIIKAFYVPIELHMSAYSGLCYGLSKTDFAVYSIKESVKMVNFGSTFKNVAFVMDQPNQRIVIANQQALMNVFSTNPQGIPEFQCSFAPKEIYSITTLSLCQQYLLAGTSQSYILVFQLFKKSKQHLSQHISTITCGPIVRSLSFCKTSKLIFTNYKNSVLVLNTGNYAQRAIQCHGEQVTKIDYFPEQELLVSSGEDGKVSFLIYRDQKNKSEQESNEVKDVQKQEKAQLNQISDWNSQK